MNMKKGNEKPLPLSEKKMKTKKIRIKHRYNRKNLNSSSLYSSLFFLPSTNIPPSRNNNNNIENKKIKIKFKYIFWMVDSTK